LVEHLSKRFGDRIAFDGVSFEVGHGEVFGFLGPNGAGKTTMVRTLGTLLSPSAGIAFISGTPLTPDNGVEIRRRIAIMPESPGLYLRLTVAERLCDRVAILNTTLRTIGRPAQLREQLFAKTLTVRTLVALPDPGGVFAGLPAVDGWYQDGPATYVLSVSEQAVAAPAATRALVAAGAEVLSISESQHSLEDVYLELIDQDEEAGQG
jgi:ABC-type multidrug transport system ATPase subunit